MHFLGKRIEKQSNGDVNSISRRIQRVGAAKTRENDLYFNRLSTIADGMVLQSGEPIQVRFLPAKSE